MSTTEPLAIYDVRDDEERQLLGTPAHERLLAWMASEKIDPTDVIRIEIHADGPHARITERDRDDQGHILVNDEGTDHRLREPFDVPIATLRPGVRKPTTTT
jgi:hypothetical protein